MNFKKKKNPSKLTKFSSTYPWPCKWATAIQHTFGDVYNIDIYLIGRIGRNFVFSLGVFLRVWRDVVSKLMKCQVVFARHLLLYFFWEIFILFFSQLLTVNRNGEFEIGSKYSKSSSWESKLHFLVNSL